MVRKDVTPHNNKNNALKKFAISLLGGLLGGLIAFGGFYYFTNGNSSNEATTTSGVTDENNKATVSNVKVKVDSDTTSAVKKVQNAVVSVINLQNSSTDEWGFGSTEQDSDSDSGLETAGEGSGVIYKKDDDKAYIVTNNHVVANQKGLEVLLADGTRETAKLVGTDAFSDLAVLTISADKVDTVATLGDSDELTVGEPAIAIGSPLGSDYANSVTQGIISSINRLVTSQSDSGEDISINAIQTDAAINPGNSGGPLINISGQVIGINSSKIASSGQSGVSVEGMGFAIPSKDVTKIISQLEDKGSVTRPALGITMIDLNVVSSEQRQSVLKLPDSIVNGVVIQNVGKSTPASEAGLKQYDVITKVDGTEVSDSSELRAALYKKDVGDKMKLTFYRNGKSQSVTVKLSEDQSIIKSQSNN